MAATIVVQEVIGSVGSKTFTTVTNRVRLFTADQATNQTTPQITYPVPIPPSSSKYSFWKHVCLDVSGTFTSVSNIRHYSDGAIGWNFGASGALLRGNMDSGDDGCGVDTANSHSDEYDQATGTGGDTGDTIASSHSKYSGETTPTADIESDTSGSPCTLESGSLTEAGKSKAVVLQVKVDSDATSGVQTAETLTFKYDVID